MKELNFDTGLVTYKLNDATEVTFNPTDSAFVERLFKTFDALDRKQDEYKTEVERTGDKREIFEITRKRDTEMRGMIDEVFGEPVCDSLFGGMNVYALAGGLTSMVQSAVGSHRRDRHQLCHRAESHQSPPAKVSRKIPQMIWDLPVSVDIQSVPYNIRTDYRCILDICAALADPELDNRDKSEAALRIFYPDYDAIPPEHWQEAVEKCLWFINGGDTPDGRKSPRLVDWEQDYSLVIAPVNRALGCEVRAMDYLHWWTFLAAYQEIRDCTFAQVVRIRDRMSRGIPLDKQNREWYRKNRHLVDFKNRYTSVDEEIMREWGGRG